MRASLILLLALAACDETGLVSKNGLPDVDGPDSDPPVDEVLPDDTGAPGPGTANDPIPWLDVGESEPGNPPSGGVVDPDPGPPDDTGAVVPDPSFDPGPGPVDPPDDGDVVPTDPTDTDPPDGTPNGGTPDGGTPGDGTPGDGTPGDGTPGDGTPGDGTPGDGTPGDGTPGDTDLPVEPPTVTTPTDADCVVASNIADHLDPFQVPGDGRVRYCHRTSPGNWVMIETDISSCVPHIHHDLDIFPTTICDS